MSRLLKINLYEIDWYGYIDEEYEWLRDFVYSPTETWNKALAKGGEYFKSLIDGCDDGYFMYVIL